MTNHKKTYIEPKDIVAVRFDCNECGSAVSLPISSQISFSSVANCPNCGRSWAAMMQTSIQPQLKECADAIWEMAELLKHYQGILHGAGSKGFTLSLEISESSSPASGGKD